MHYRAATDDSSNHKKLRPAADRPRDAMCHSESCQLLHNSARTTCTTSPEQIAVLELEGYSRRTWRRGVVVSGVRRMNEVNARRARLVLGWVTVFIPSRYVISQLGQLSLASLRGRLIEYQLRLG